MDMMEVISLYSPWKDPESSRTWQNATYEFHRPVFKQLMEELGSISQMLSVTGPRRVGKTTLLQQMIKSLIEDHKVDPQKIIYYSMDDPALSQPHLSAGSMLEEMIHHLSEENGGDHAYLFLDEIQAFPEWEKHLKKYYDLNFPVRIIISGSATSPIFKASRESLLGRIKDYHILPFSFAEFLLYQERNNRELTEEITEIKKIGTDLTGMLISAPEQLNLEAVNIPNVSDALWNVADAALEQYFIEGGFPEVWEFKSQKNKMDYLFDNQVNKVIYEDLVLAAEFRKPEQLKHFFVSLLAEPGQEVSRSKLSKNLGINVQQIEKYLPLLEMTDLIWHAEKFRPSSVRARRGNQKFYLVDLALRNAVLRIGQPDLLDDTMRGIYAENLVFNGLKKIKGALQIDYYRKGDAEIDFILHLRPQQYLPIEVKYRNRWTARDVTALLRFAKTHPSPRPIVITKQRNDFGRKEESRDLLMIPLILFLLLTG